MALKTSSTNRLPAFLAMSVMNATKALEAEGADVHQAAEDALSRAKALDET